MITYVCDIPDFLRQRLELLTTGNRFRRRLLQRYTKLGEGDSASVYLFHGYALKVYDKEYTETDDPYNLEKLHGLPYFPRLVAYADSVFVLMEYVDGRLLSSYTEDLVDFQPLWYLHLKSALELACKEDVILTDVHMNNIIIRNEIPVIVDLGSSDDIFSMFKNNPNKFTLNALVESYNNRLQYFIDTQIQYSN